MVARNYSNIHLCNARIIFNFTSALQHSHVPFSLIFFARSLEKIEVGISKSVCKRDPETTHVAATKCFLVKSFCIVNASEPPAVENIVDIKSKRSFIAFKKIFSHGKVDTVLFPVLSLRRYFLRFIFAHQLKTKFVEQRLASGIDAIVCSKLGFPIESLVA